MSSGPMQKCCVSGVLHKGTPVGHVETIAENIKAYLTYPPNKSTSHAIIILTDVYGYTFPNTRLIADAFAAAGYFTVIPDLFNGAEVPFPPPKDFNLQTYIDKTMPRVDSVDPIIEKTISYLRSEKGVEKIGGVGYCFGGKYVCRWLKDGGIDAGYVAHPSFVDKEEVQGVRGALSIAAAQVDEIFTRQKRYETEEILAGTTVPWHIFVYSDTEHGFAVKGDLGTKKARLAKERAFQQAVGWFEEHLKEGEE